MGDLWVLIEMSEMFEIKIFSVIQLTNTNRCFIVKKVNVCSEPKEN